MSALVAPADIIATVGRAQFPAAENGEMLKAQKDPTSPAWMKAIENRNEGRFKEGNADSIGAADETPSQSPTTVDTGALDESGKTDDGSALDGGKAPFERSLVPRTKIISALLSDSLECPICIGVIKSQHRVWACRDCFTVFHLPCIHCWAKTTEEELTPLPFPPPPSELNEVEWKCPNCQCFQEGIPDSYKCWCGSVTNPQPPSDALPHSCGGICGKPLWRSHSKRATMDDNEAGEDPKQLQENVSGCNHSCEDVCHPGLCNQCTRLVHVPCPSHNTPIAFPCGSVRQPEEDVPGYPCEQPCGKQLDCGAPGHFCGETCHGGPCPPCPRPVLYPCPCKRSFLLSRCSDEHPKEVGWIIDATEAQEWLENGAENRTPTISEKDEENGTAHVLEWRCDTPCGANLPCGVHKCSVPCHVMVATTDESPPSTETHTLCHRDPSVWLTCACGKVTEDELGVRGKRSRCTDRLTGCRNPCSKVLSCGHKCPKKCHDGPCPTCEVQVNISCRCGATTTATSCGGLGRRGSRANVCLTPCHTLLSCGLHRCDAICCPNRIPPNTIHATHLLGLKRRKSWVPVDLKGDNEPVVDDNEAMWDPDEVEEHWCDRVCGKLLKCGKHNCKAPCHPGRCGPCLETDMTELRCGCGRTVVKAPVPCGTSVPECPFPCERPQQCGHPILSTHPCHTEDVPCPPCAVLTIRQCPSHDRPVPNVPCQRKSAASCGRVCAKTLLCGLHLCEKPCHAGDCLPVGIKCTRPCVVPRGCGHPCGKPCHPGTECQKDDPCGTKYEARCPCTRRKDTRTCTWCTSDPSMPEVQLKCDEICETLLKFERHATTKGEQDGLPSFTEEILSHAKIYPEFVARVDATLTEFVRDQSRSIYYFPPTSEHHRRFIHNYANSHWALQTESLDEGKNRSVTVMKRVARNKSEETHPTMQVPLMTVTEFIHFVKMRSVRRKSMPTAPRLPLERPPSGRTSAHPPRSFIPTGPRASSRASSTSSLVINEDEIDGDSDYVDSSDEDASVMIPLNDDGGKGVWKHQDYDRKRSISMIVVKSKMSTLDADVSPRDGPAPENAKGRSVIASKIESSVEAGDAWTEAVNHRRRKSTGHRVEFAMDEFAQKYSKSFEGKSLGVGRPQPVPDEEGFLEASHHGRQQRKRATSFSSSTVGNGIKGRSRTSSVNSLVASANQNESLAGATGNIFALLEDVES
ncbi:hypothetical protein M427DRAFT_59068 [Gonapodya prolifera JEL478]|uniref:R3H domain-containing protein n=1 Tax=Gonapodya prolifera (strain JEL478) TaxID=1344416 RepID=A0A139A899_GONPJ|nr:hypothetical protein M427DRAFT_59068 [Gonapodya prolifera JEL478]|eukprot:KXS12957.1 hypothetical protein M427DRAFT_59068 [Gonapodya prolifera JEL478]